MWAGAAWADADAGPPPLWPAPGAQLRPIPFEKPPKKRKVRLYLDAGHGAPGNKGAASVTCEDEQEHTLRVAQHLAAALERTGAFKVQVSRKAHGEAPYAERLAAAAAFGAQAIVSLHSDSRGTARYWTAPNGQWCPRADLMPGYALLWSDDADRPLRNRRLKLARALSRRLTQTGFVPYSGVDYEGLYEPTPPEPGVFVDRHLPGQRIFFLRRPAIPSVIIETHHALDFEEVARWQEPGTLDAFAQAVAAGLVDALLR